MVKAEEDCGPIPEDLYPSLQPSFNEGIIDIADPQVLKDEIVNLVKGKNGYEKIEQAMDLAFEAHADQPDRLEGKPYIIHPLRVAWRLLQYWQQIYGVLPPSDDLYIALFHDVLEDSRKVSQKKIEAFGKPVLRGVKVLTKKYKHGKIKGKLPREYFAGIRAESANIQIIKILDRTDNMWSLSSEMPSKFIRKQLIETRRYVMPIARNFPLLCHDLSSAMEPFGPRRTRRQR